MLEECQLSRENRHDGLPDDHVRGRRGTSPRSPSIGPTRSTRSTTRWPRNSRGPGRRSVTPTISTRWCCRPTASGRSRRASTRRATAGGSCRRTSGTRSIPGHAVAEVPPQGVEAGRRRGARHVRRRRSVLHQRGRHHHLLRRCPVLRPARQRRDRVGTRADRDARPGRSPRRRVALGADGLRRTDHSADTALRIGLVSEVVARDDLRARARASSRPRSPNATRPPCRAPSERSGSRST